MFSRLNIFKKYGTKHKISRNGSTRRSKSKRRNTSSKSKLNKTGKKESESESEQVQKNEIIMCTKYSSLTLESKSRSSDQREDVTSNEPTLKIIKKKSDTLSRFLHEEVIGKDEMFRGPFGWRKCIYVDTTASGKPLKLIEDCIRENVLPFYANTHTTTSHTAFMMSSYREDARRCIREAVGARKEDTVLFCGSGCTGAIHKLIHCLNIGNDEKPIIFVGPYEHHSNLLPWRETGAQMINIPEADSGSLDDNILKHQLKVLTSKKQNKGRRVFGCFSAGSNVTGATSDDVKITKLIHEFGGLCFWDYAAAAPHLKIEMNPCCKSKRVNSGSTDSNCPATYLVDEKKAWKDALYFSGHKFPGGPQTTGVLVMKQILFKNPVPHNAGGGTVFFVTPEKHAYLTVKEEAEEGGTPAIVECIRLGLVMALHGSIGSKYIISREAYFTRKALSLWKETPGLHILGNPELPRLPIISFVIVHPESGFQLHQNFVVALLNDLFGIQCRGGCMCAGPYAQVLLGIDLKLAEEFQRVLSTPVHPFQSQNYDNWDEEGTSSYFEMIYRPGFTRISFPFEASDDELNFVIKSVQIVAQHGWKLLTKYKVCPRTGEFKFFSTHQGTSTSISISNPAVEHRHPHRLDDLLWQKLHEKSTGSRNNATKNKESPQTRTDKKIEPILEYTNILKKATEIFDSIRLSSERPFVQNLEPKLNISSKHLRWFMLPSDAASYLWTGCTPRRKTYYGNKSRFHVDPNRYKKFNESQSALKEAATRRFFVNSIPFQLQRFWQHESMLISDEGKEIYIMANKPNRDIRICGRNKGVDTYYTEPMIPPHPRSAPRNYSNEESYYSLMQNDLSQKLMSMTILT